MWESSTFLESCRVGFEPKSKSEVMYLHKLGILSIKYEHNKGGGSEVILRFRNRAFINFLDRGTCLQTTISLRKLRESHISESSFKDTSTSPWTKWVWSGCIMWNSHIINKIIMLRRKKSLIWLLSIINTSFGLFWVDWLHPVSIHILLLYLWWENSKRLTNKSPPVLISLTPYWSTHGGRLLRSHDVQEKQTEAYYPTTS